MEKQEKEKKMDKKHKVCWDMMINVGFIYLICVEGGEGGFS